MKTTLLLITLSITIMIGYSTLGGEKLVTENGQVAAKTLPLDQETSKLAFETATFGIGWFWGPDSQFGSLNGVLRTRVGYCGGNKENPTYYTLGDQTEAISIDYDPQVITYEQLLGYFWKAHRCDLSNRSRQYMNAVFYQNENQQKAAEISRAREAQRLGIPVEAVKTEILPVRKFTYAEAYHQKYYLTRHSEIREFLNKTYPDGKSLADSTVATRLNAYLGSGMQLDWQTFLKELPQYGLPEALEQRLQKMAQNKS